MIPCCFSCLNSAISTPRDAIQASGTNYRNKIIDNGKLIPFDTVNFAGSSGITFNKANASFTVLKAGSYVIYYYLNINGSSMDTNIKISCNGVECEAANSVQAQIVGFTCLKLKQGGVITLRNVSNQQILLADCSIQTGILITKI